MQNEFQESQLTCGFGRGSSVCSHKVLQAGNGGQSQIYSPQAPRGDLEEKLMNICYLFVVCPSGDMQTEPFEDKICLSTDDEA